MCNHANGIFIRRPAEDFPLSKLRADLRRCSARPADVKNHDIRDDLGSIERNSLYLGATIGEKPCIFVVAMQVLRRFFQGNQSCRSKHPYLAHASAEQLVRDVRLLNELA